MAIIFLLEDYLLLEYQFYRDKEYQLLLMFLYSKSSCTRTFDFESRITLTANTVLVSSTSPSGIIPIIAATDFITAVL